MLFSLIWQTDLMYLARTFWSADIEFLYLCFFLNPARLQTAAFTKPGLQCIKKNYVLIFVTIAVTTGGVISQKNIKTHGGKPALLLLLYCLCQRYDKENTNRVRFIQATMK